MRHLPALVWCLLSLIWGSTCLAIKIGGADLPPFTFAGIRLLVAAPVLSAAFAIVLIKARGRAIDALGLTVCQMSLGCLPLLALGFIREGSRLAHPWTRSAWVALLYLAVVGSAFAFVLRDWLIERMDVTKTQLISLASTRVAIVLGALLLGERLTPSGLALARLGFLQAAQEATP